MSERNAEYRPSVLLVEDEQDCRWLWRWLLDGDERFGTVAEAGSSREALELMTRNYFDIVITDVRMPGRSGLDLLDELRGRYPMPMIVVTSACHDVATLALDRGASAFWTKAESISTDMSQALWTLWTTPEFTGPRTQPDRAVCPPDMNSNTKGARDTSRKACDGGNAQDRGV